MVESPPLGTTITRKLSKKMRVANVFYKFILLGFSIANLLLLSIDNGIQAVSIPKLYFEIISVGMGVLPIIWSSILDACKSINVNASLHSSPQLPIVKPIPQPPPPEKEAEDSPHSDTGL